MPLRYEILKSFSKAVKGCGKGATDATLKEVSKIARNALADKYSIIKSAGAEVGFVCVSLLYLHIFADD